LLTPAGDAASFAEAVQTLLCDEARRSAFAAAAVRKVKAEHDTGAAGAALDRIVRDLVDGRT
jgi:glycosyltransferase involved in cell wall biosynthesis